MFVQMLQPHGESVAPCEGGILKTGGPWLGHEPAARGTDSAAKAPCLLGGRHPREVSPRKRIPSPLLGLRRPALRLLQPRGLSVGPGDGGGSLTRPSGLPSQPPPLALVAHV